jgi:hypothetical protein
LPTIAWPPSATETSCTVTFAFQSAAEKTGCGSASRDQVGPDQ